jgi:hypothetical protein
MNPLAHRHRSIPRGPVEIHWPEVEVKKSPDRSERLTEPADEGAAPGGARSWNGSGGPGRLLDQPGIWRGGRSNPHGERRGHREAVRSGTARQESPSACDVAHIAGILRMDLRPRILDVSYKFPKDGRRSEFLFRVRQGSWCPGVPRCGWRATRGCEELRTSSPEAWDRIRYVVDTPRMVRIFRLGRLVPYRSPPGNPS